MKTIIDVSKWNTIQDYEAVSKNIDGVIIRCGYRGSNTGAITTDPSFVNHATNFAKYNTPIGIYFFTTALNDEEGKAEADYVIKLVKAMKLTLQFPIFVDTEWCDKNHTGRSDSTSNENRTSAIIAFCKEIIANGYTAGVYASDNWFANKVDYNKLKGYYIWVASYNHAPTHITKYSGWQPGSKVFTGSASPIDIDYWYIDISPNAAKVKATTTTTTTYHTGDKITLNNTPLYSSSTASKIAAYKTGIFYIWSMSIINNRIRITNSKDNVSKVSSIVGWINVPNTKLTVTLSTGQKVTLKNAGLYPNSTVAKPTIYKSGTFYIWSKTPVNNRVRITDDKDRVGKIGSVTGWVKVSDLIL